MYKCIKVEIKIRYVGEWVMVEGTVLMIYIMYVKIFWVMLMPSIIYVNKI